MLQANTSTKLNSVHEPSPRSLPSDGTGRKPAGSMKWVQPSGPRASGQGVEEEEQGIISAAHTPSEGAMLRVTLLAAGFVIGPGGSSVRQIMSQSGAEIKSWTDHAKASRGRPSRIFVVEGEQQSIAAALQVVCMAINKYKDLCEGRHCGQHVHRSQMVCNIEFSYQPPPRHVVPHAAALKGPTHMARQQKVRRMQTANVLSELRSALHTQQTLRASHCSTGPVPHVDRSVGDQIAEATVPGHNQGTPSSRCNLRVSMGHAAMQTEFSCSNPHQAAQSETRRQIPESPFQDHLSDTGQQDAQQSFLAGFLHNQDLSTAQLVENLGCRLQQGLPSALRAHSSAPARIFGNSRDSSLEAPGIPAHFSFQKPSSVCFHLRPSTSMGFQRPLRPPDSTQRASHHKSDAAVLSPITLHHAAPAMLEHVAGNGVDGRMLHDARPNTPSIRRSDDQMPGAAADVGSEAQIQQHIKRVGHAFSSNSADADGPAFDAELLLNAGLDLQDLRYQTSNALVRATEARGMMPHPVGCFKPCSGLQLLSPRSILHQRLSSGSYSGGPKPAMGGSWPCPGTAMHPGLATLEPAAATAAAATAASAASAGSIRGFHAPPADAADQLPFLMPQ